MCEPPDANVFDSGLSDGEQRNEILCPYGHWPALVTSKLTACCSALTISHEVNRLIPSAVSTGSDFWCFSALLWSVNMVSADRPPPQRNQWSVYLSSHLIHHLIHDTDCAMDFKQY